MMLTVEEVYQKVVDNIQSGTVSGDDFNALFEAMPKSVKERVFRRTRPANAKPKSPNMAGKVAPKKKADNNPIKGRGKRFKSGSTAKIKQNEEQKKRVAKEQVELCCNDCLHKIKSQLDLIITESFFFCKKCRSNINITEAQLKSLNPVEVQLEIDSALREASNEQQHHLVKKFLAFYKHWEEAESAITGLYQFLDDDEFESIFDAKNSFNALKMIRAIVTYFLEEAPDVNKDLAAVRKLCARSIQLESTATDPIKPAREKWEHQVTGGDDIGWFSVPVLYRIAKEKGLKKSMPVESLKGELSWWDGNAEHARKTDTSFPVLVLQMEDGSLTLADGLNRLWKRINLEKGKTIEAYVLPVGEIPDSARGGNRNDVALNEVKQLISSELNKDKTIIKLREVCDSFSDIYGLGPDYQRLFWHPKEKKVWWESFDGDEEDSLNEIRRRLEKVGEISEVRIESESSPKDDGWLLIWPEKESKVWVTSESTEIINARLGR